MGMGFSSSKRKLSGGKMGFSSCRTGSCTSVGCSCHSTPIDTPQGPVGCPNQYDFDIIQIIQGRHGHTLVKLKYPDATEFSGIKLLLFAPKVWERIKKSVHTDGIDPHFLENDTSPIARFSGSKEGVAFANGVLKLLNDF